MPFPLTEVLGGRVFKTLDVIKAFVVEFLMKGLKGPGDFRKIDDPSGSALYLPLYMNLNPEDMPVHVYTLMAGQRVRQSVSDINVEDLENNHRYSPLRNPEQLMDL